MIDPTLVFVQKEVLSRFLRNWPGKGLHRAPGRGSVEARKGALNGAQGSLGKSPKLVPRRAPEGAPKIIQGDPGKGKGKGRRNQIMGATE
jgi:hypothetical protein